MTARRRHKVRPELLDLLLPLADLAPHPDNPWNGDDEELAASLVEFGQDREIQYQASTGYVLRGNTTYAAALSIGWTHAAAAGLDVDDEQALAILLGDNKAKDGAAYDLPALDVLLHRAGSLAGTGYPPDALEQLARRLPAPVAPADPYVLPGALAGPLDPVERARQAAAPLSPVLGDIPDLPYPDHAHDLRQTVLVYSRVVFEKLAALLDDLQDPEETWTDVVTRVVLRAEETL